MCPGCPSAPRFEGKTSTCFKTLGTGKLPLVLKPSAWENFHLFYKAPGKQQQPEAWSEHWELLSALTGHQCSQCQPGQVPLGSHHALATTAAMGLSLAVFLASIKSCWSSLISLAHSPRAQGGCDGSAEFPEAGIDPKALSAASSTGKTSAQA